MPYIIGITGILFVVYIIAFTILCGAVALPKNVVYKLHLLFWDNLILVLVTGAISLLGSILPNEIFWAPAKIGFLICFAIHVAAVFTFRDALENKN